MEHKLRSILLIEPPSPACAGLARPLAPAAPAADAAIILARGHALEPGFLDDLRSDLDRLARQARSVHACVVWSGTLGDELFDADPRTWGPRGRAAWAERLAELLAVARSHRLQLWIRPHARHVVSDAPTIDRMLADHAGDIAHEQAPLRILSDPASMFTRSMLAYAEDHLERVLSATRRWSALGACAGIVLANVRDPSGEPAAEASPIDDGPALQGAPLFDGLIPAPIIRSLTPALLPSTLPILLPFAGDEGQVRAFA
jgi:hypothetical protein